MKPLTLQQIRQAVGGRAMSPIPQHTPLITAVCTDTRRMEPSSLFVAIRGERYNGNNFIPDAAKGGAIAALVEELPDTSLPNVHLIKVDNARVALGKLARYVRKTLKSKVVAVAGSNGKTSTKHLIHAALSGKLRGSISPKSFNNDIGVPLTIFPADTTQDYLVLEIGTNHHGEIKVLSDMAMPDIAVITNVGADHLEGLDDLMGVRRENAMIISGLNPRGCLVVNGDDADLLAAVNHYPGTKVKFGFGEHNDLFATDVSWDHEGTRFNLNGSKNRTVYVPMIGKHTAANALAALAVARRMGVSEDQAIADLARSTGPDMRMQRHEMGRMTLINDAYNANPNSMHAAIDTIAGLPATGRRVAILGDMLELGAATERYHREIGQHAASAKFDLLICVGKNAALYRESAIASGMPESNTRHFADAKAAAKSILKMLQATDLIVLKASRSIRLEEVAQVILKGQARFFPLAAAG